MNEEIASRLEEVARILEHQGANRFRVEAYRKAADTLRAFPVPVTEIVNKGGLEELKQLHGIGDSLARSIYQLATTGRLPMLERLRGESDPVELLSTVPGIGKRLAERIYEDLGIHTLEELEAAAHDGRLSDIEAIGGKRLAGIRDSLAWRLGRVRVKAGSIAPAEPPVSELLAVDEEYRIKAEKHSLPFIAPRRFNPDHAAWLPILHAQRGDCHYTVLFSNTALAHKLQKTHDWVVIYWECEGRERQYTAVTDYKGPLQGMRVIRGRETECEMHYRQPAHL